MQQFCVLACAACLPLRLPDQALHLIAGSLQCGSWHPVMHCFLIQHYMEGAAAT